MDRQVGKDFYAFLYSMGYKESVDRLFEKIKLYDSFARAVYIFSFIETVAKDAGEPSVIRAFFKTYGPLGAAVYTKCLVEEGAYEARSHTGEELLNKIVKVDVNGNGDILQLYAKNQELIKQTLEDLPMMTCDNPYLLKYGLFDSSEIVCLKSDGCFCLSLYGRKLPVGFVSYVNEGKKHNKSK